ncbi:MAG: DUF2147 domain-containing protein [Cytophagales bacterium]
MNRITRLICILLLPAGLFAQSSVVGKWKSIDDKSGEVRSIVEIFEKNSKLYGKIIKVFPRPNEDPDPVCEECAPEDDRYKKKILGMEIIREMKKDDQEYVGGYILDPEVGKVYRCKLWLENGSLKVRGYLGPFFRTQTWQIVP